MLLQKLVYVAQVGASAVLWILIALSVLSIGVIIERWWFFSRRRLDFAAVSESLRKHLTSGDVSGAQKALENNRAVEADVVREALTWYEDGPEPVQEILQKGVRQRRKSLEGGLLFLGTLGNNAPFVGLFGTVLGVVAAFRELGTSQSAMASGGGGMGNVMSAIGEALIATAIGILVALPAVIAYNVFQKKGADIEENAAALGNLLIAAMKSRRNPAPQARSRESESAPVAAPAPAPEAMRPAEAKA